MLGCVVAGDAVRRRVEQQMGTVGDLEPRWVVPSAHDAGISNGYDHPSRLGADRWVALAGARQRVLEHAAGGPPRPALVVMVGTAVTVDALDAERPLPRRPHPAGLRSDAESAGDRHRRAEGADGRGGGLPHQHQRRL